MRAVSVLLVPCLLAAVALQVVHRVDRNCVAADGVIFEIHDGLPVFTKSVLPNLLRKPAMPFSLTFLPHRSNCSCGGYPLYNVNHTPVIPLDVVFCTFFCRAARLRGTTDIDWQKMSRHGRRVAGAGASTGNEQGMDASSIRLLTT
jgi:hypothetical protein